MRTGQMALTAVQGQQAAQRTHMGRSEAETRMRAAEHTVDDVQRVVVTADDEEGTFDLFARADEFGLHGLTGIETFAVARHTDDGIGAGKAGHGPGSARQGNGVAGIAHHAQTHADAFFHARAGGQGVAGHHVQMFLMSEAALLPQGEKRKDKFFHSNDG